MRILLLEDDPDQALDIQAEIAHRFPGAEIEHLYTESDFMARLDDVVHHPPDGIIMDVMLPWAKPSPNMPPCPESVRSEGQKFAGFRCASRLWAAGVRVPMIFYTVLRDNDLMRDRRWAECEAMYVQKKASFDSLVDRIRRDFVSSKPSRPA